MHEILNFNAVSVATNLVCGTLGHLCLALSPTVYATLSTTIVSPPLNPGAMPVILAGATGPEAASIRYAHDAGTLGFNTFANVDRELRQQLLGAVDDTFLQVLHKLHRGYSGSSMLDLLTHIYAMYDVISNADWLENDKRFRESYLPAVLIEVAWQQFDDAVAYADASSMPYSSNQVTDNAYQLVFNTGIFAADCWEWNQRTGDNKTLPDLNTFFATAHREWSLLLKTRPALPTSPRTMPPHAQTKGAYNKRRWT